MRILLYIARIFIDTFGITHPSLDERNRAARYIAFLIAILFLLLCGTIVVAMNVR